MSNKMVKAQNLNKSYIKGIFAWLIEHIVEEKMLFGRCFGNARHL